MIHVLHEHLREVQQRRHRRRGLSIQAQIEHVVVLFQPRCWSAHRFTDTAQASHHTDDVYQQVR
jgi:hypothetical protein